MEDYKIDKTIYNKNIYVDKDKLEYWKNMLNRDDIDYDEMKWKAYSNVAIWTARFSDGCEMDIKVNTNDTDDHDLFSEAILFDNEGYQLSFTDIAYDLEGEWKLEYGGNTYSVNIVGV